jgi:prepilin-type N-terminal cleavage/methylation domain-containing protein
MPYRGFTLVELIIVVVVISILATIAIPQYLNAVERGRINNARSVLIRIVQGAKVFAVDNIGACPAAANPIGAAITNYVNAPAGDADWIYSNDAACGAVATRRNSAPGVIWDGDIVSFSAAGAWGGNHDLL